MKFAGYRQRRIFFISSRALSDFVLCADKDILPRLHSKEIR